MNKLYVVLMFIAFMPALASAEDTLLKGSLSVGEKAQNFSLPNTKKSSITLYEELKKGPVILSFYRGGWCPVCNIQLHNYQEKMAEIKALGGQLIAVSPETPTNAELTIVKNALNFEVLSDDKNKIARKYGIVWQVPADDREKFSAWLKDSTGKTLKDYNNHESYELPIPATFVIAKDGTVVYAFKDVDYSKRAEISDILKALKDLKK